MRAMLSAALLVSLGAAAGSAQPPAPLIHQATGQFRVVVPAGFSPSEEPPPAPHLASFSRDAFRGPELLVVERHEGDALSREAFIAHLTPRGPPRRTTRKLGGKSFDVYEGLVIESMTGRLPTDDPSQAALGEAFEPPRLSLFERRRFHPGGDAYRLYRCRKLGAWGVIGDWGRAERQGTAGIEEFRAALDTNVRNLLSACFGSFVLTAIDRGSELPPTPKPSMYRLRLLAREEWRGGSLVRQERESVHVREGKGGFYVLRYRAPRESFRRKTPDFLAFLAGFEVLE